MDNERQARIESVRIMVEYNWMYLHQVYLAASAKFGEKGVQAIAAGIRRHGRYRGDYIRSSAEGCARGRDAMALMCAWDTAELPLASAGDVLDVGGDARQATVSLEWVPGSEYFEGKDSASVLAIYWTELLAGVSMGYDEGLSIFCGPLSEPGAVPWTITLSFTGDVSQSKPEAPSDAFTNPAAAIVMSQLHAIWPPPARLNG